jgi:hypothetical protein
VSENTRLLVHQVRSQSGQNLDPDLDVEPLQPPDRALGILRQPVEFVQVQRDHGRIRQCEVDVEVDQGIEQGTRVVRMLTEPSQTTREQALADRRQRRDQHRLFAGEVVVERRAGNAGGGADVIHGHAVVAALGEQPDRDIQDLIAPGAPPDTR